MVWKMRKRNIETLIGALLIGIGLFIAGCAAAKKIGISIDNSGYEQFVPDAIRKNQNSMIIYEAQIKAIHDIAENFRTANARNDYNAAKAAAEAGNNAIRGLSNYVSETEVENFKKTHPECTGDINFIMESGIRYCVFYRGNFIWFYSNEREKK